MVSCLNHGGFFKCVLRQRDGIPRCRHLCVKMQQCMQCRQGRQGKTLFTKCRSCEGCISANLCRSNRSKTQATQPDEKQKRMYLNPVRNISLQHRQREVALHSRTSLMDNKPRTKVGWNGFCTWFQLFGQGPRDWQGWVTGMVAKSAGEGKENMLEGYM